MAPKLKLTFKEPRHGYWDGGAKSGGEFTPEDNLGMTIEEHPGVGQPIWWGSFYLNFYFKAKAGRSWREAGRIAQRRLCNLTGVPATVEVIQ